MQIPPFFSLCKYGFRSHEGTLLSYPVDADMPSTILNTRAGARFSKVPKLFGRISGDILFVSSKRKSLESRIFAVIIVLYSLYII